MDISIIIPAFNESRKISQDILAADELIRTHFSSGEILIIDDGSSDNTNQIAEQTIVKKPSILKNIRYEPHHGKGHAVRTGVLLSKGNIVMFADSGLCIPYSNALRGIALIQNGICDIAHGSRHLPESIIRIPQRLKRRVSARLFHWLVVYTMNIPVTFTDTQCGLKIYKGNIARELYQECQAAEFMFDIEIILRALQWGYRIIEFAVEWSADLDSRLVLHKTFSGIFKELHQIHRSLR